MNLATPHPLALGNLRDAPLAEIIGRAETNPIHYRPPGGETCGSDV